MYLSCKRVVVSIVVIPLLGLVGCQKGGDSSQPAAAVAGPNAEKSDGGTTPAAGPKSDQDPQHPVFEIETTLGKCTIQLDGEKAPLTVDNFRNYVAKHHYEQTIFHQVLNGSVKAVLGGGFLADLSPKKALTPIRNEAHNGLKNRRGSISMFRRADDCDSATSQFIINLADNDKLDFKGRTPEQYGYCVFGQVTQGIEVLDQIVQRPVHDTNNFDHVPVETVAIKSIQQVK